METETITERMPIADVRGDLDTVIDHVQATKQPIVVTRDSTAAVIIIDAAQYQKERQERDLLRGILAGEDAVRAGKVISMEEVEARLDAILAEETEP